MTTDRTIRAEKASALLASIKNDRFVGQMMRALGEHHANMGKPKDVGMWCQYVVENLKEAQELSRSLLFIARLGLGLWMLVIAEFFGAIAMAVKCETHQGWIIAGGIVAIAMTIGGVFILKWMFDRRNIWLKDYDRRAEELSDIRDDVATVTYCLADGPMCDMSDIGVQLKQMAILIVELEQPDVSDDLISHVMKIRGVLKSFRLSEIKREYYSLCDLVNRVGMVEIVASKILASATDFVKTSRASKNLAAMKGFVQVLISNQQ